MRHCRALCNTPAISAMLHLSQQSLWWHKNVPYCFLRAGSQELMCLPWGDEKQFLCRDEKWSKRRGHTFCNWSPCNKMKWVYSLVLIKDNTSVIVLLESCCRHCFHAVCPPGYWIDEAIENILWSKYFMEVQGSNLEPMVMHHQDMNAIILTTNGIASITKRTTIVIKIGSSNSLEQ